MRYLIRATIASFALGLIALGGQAQPAGGEADTHVSADSAWGRAISLDHQQ
ncbi:hypothetical protein [Streptomyces sp. NPDC059862]|uniref:hypothetical protein n=1 Tax=unclassified Streptomyces TaxID=2593676 RepID=UPI0036334B6C